MVDLSSCHQSLEQLFRSGRQPSLSAAAYAQDRLWTETLGTADPLGLHTSPGSTTQFRIGSITKPQVAVAVMALVEAGEVDLDRPISAWVPDAPAGGATVRQFLSHTSGLPAEPQGPWWERAGGGSWDQLASQGVPQLAPPGTRFHYSNLGFAVLGRLVEVVNNQTWDAVLADILWRPLGMKDTGRRPGPDHAVGVAVHPDEDLLYPEPVARYQAMGPAGELWSTPRDLVRFGKFLNGDGEGLNVLHPDTLRFMRTPFAFEDRAGRPWTNGYGLGVSVVNIRGERQFGHSGSVPGFTARLTINPATSAVLAVCGNATNRLGNIQPLLDALVGAPPPPDEPQPPASATPRPTDSGEGLVGTWFWGPSEYRLTRDQGLLTLVNLATPADHDHFILIDDGWVGVGGGYFHGERLRLVRDLHRRIRQLDIATFCFTRTPYDPDADLPGGADPLGWRPGGLSSASLTD